MSGKLPRKLPQRRRTINYTIPWQALDLVATKLDPKSLGKASCVSKSWLSSMSSDHLWKSICTTHFPSLSNLHPTIPYHRIYSLGHSSAKRRRQLPPEPRLSLADLLFAVTIPAGTTRSSSTTIVKPFSHLKNNPQGRFRFDVKVEEKIIIDEEEDDDMRISCFIVKKGNESVYRVLERKGKTSRRDWWFTEELPSAGCCFYNVGSGLLAEVSLVFGERVIEKKRVVVVDKIRIGVMNVVSTWRYASVDDTLRYLQHFLLSTPPV